MRKLILAAAFLVSVSPASAQDFSANVESSIQSYNRPAVAAFAKAAVGLPQAVDAVCREVTDASRDGFAKQFGDVVAAFGKIALLRYGPLLDDDRLARLAFIPDPRRIAERQIRKVFAKKDETATDAATLKDKSVAVQGLTALELIAFDKDSAVVLGDPGDAHDFTCAYAKAISVNVANIADNLDKAWADPDGYSKELFSPGQKDSHIRSSKEAMETIFNALSTGLTIVKDQDLEAALGESPKKAKPYRMPFSRSGNGLTYVSAELQGLDEAVKAAEFAPLLDDEFAWTLDSLAYEFGNAQNLLSEIDPPIRKTLKVGKTYDRLKVLLITINSLRDTLALELAGALSLSGGFNALDGD